MISTRALPMHPLTAAAAMNRLPLWRRTLRVWDFTLTPPTLDRWVYLWMHRLGRMGGGERRFFTTVLRPGMRVADVGANIGLYSLLFSRLVGPQGHVAAFEPDPLMAAALRANVRTNAEANGGIVDVFECAVGAAAAERVLRRNALNSGDNRLEGSMRLAPGGEVRIQVRALPDMLRDGRVDLIKIDVQGWEAEVFAGLRPLVESNPGLLIYFEIWPDGLVRSGSSVEDFAALLQRLGLRACVPMTSVAVDLVEYCHRMKAGEYTNLVASR